jgi:hypothetical protein
VFAVDVMTDVVYVHRELWSVKVIAPAVDLELLAHKRNVGGLD